MDFVAGMIAGLFVGSTAGMIIAALCVAAGENDDEK